MKKDLLITQKDKKQVLSKQQQTFNRLVQKIEKLHKEHDKLKQSLDQKLKYFQERILPLNEEILKGQKNLIQIFYVHYSENKSLKKADKQVIKNIISEIFEDIFHETNFDDELKTIYKKIYGSSYEKAIEEDKEESFQEMKEQMEFMFNQAGFDMNMNGLHSNMSEEQMFQKVKEMEAEFQKQSGQQEASSKRKKTKREELKQEKEKEIQKAKSKNISSIYKQLAKLFHPDLEPDPEMKSEKEELMKRLIAAHENNDLHTLLHMELQWIHKEENNAEKLTDEKLSIYNEIMKEQAQDIAFEINETVFHPQYQILRNYVEYPLDIKSMRPETLYRKMNDDKQKLEQSIKYLQSDKEIAMRELKLYIKDFHAEENAILDDFDNFQNALIQMLNASNFKDSKKNKW